MTQENEGQEKYYPSEAFEFIHRLSKRDYACIHLKVPKTGKEWLDALITESLRNEMAGRAMQGIIANSGVDMYPRGLAKLAHEQADALLSTGKGEGNET